MVEDVAENQKQLKTHMGYRVAGTAVFKQRCEADAAKEQRNGSRINAGTSGVGQGHAQVLLSVVCWLWVVADVLTSCMYL